MINQCTLGAIFALFILRVHCDKAANYNEVKPIYIPSAPQNLTVQSVKSNEIELSWTPPSSIVLSYPTGATTNVSLPIRPQRDDFSRDEQQMLADSRSQRSEHSADQFLDQKNRLKYDESPMDLMGSSYRVKREMRTHRHRRRRQENVTDTKDPAESFEDPSKDILKKSGILDDGTKVAYVLYYEESVQNDKFSVSGIQNQKEIENYFASNLGFADYYSRNTKNLTLRNNSKKLSKLVIFHLRDLKPFTAYKVWVRAYYNEENLTRSALPARVGPPSDTVYVLTDVHPPSPPIILNVTCDTPGFLYLHWRQPLSFNNSLDQYVVTLRKIPEHNPRKTLKFSTNKDDLEISIRESLDLWNNSRYEVRIHAATSSIAHRDRLIVGSESAPEEVSNESCVSATSRVAAEHTAELVLFAVTPVLLLLAVVAGLLYWKCRSRLSKCISAAYNYLEEGGDRAVRAQANALKKPVVTGSPVRAGGASDVGVIAGAGRPPRMSAAMHPAVSKRLFPRHVAALHADGDLGFSKEYEIVVSKSAVLGHSSHHSHRPENRMKNRYLNITAYDHSRVCVSTGGRCGAAGCVGGASAGGGAPGGGACDYVNANFIDGMLPALDARARARIAAKLRRREQPNRQPSVKPTKPPPSLAEGIESAFLNIEFSGIVEDTEQNDSDSEPSDDDSELDDVYVDIDGVMSRVKLEWVVWRRRYIATQGPTPATLDAFWRMIWQHRVHTVVMITNLVERGRRKCDMYWPAGGGVLRLGPVAVRLAREDVRAAYTVRTLHVTCDQTNDSDSVSPNDSSGRIVMQYHYTMWPDHGTPRHPLAVLPFVKAASSDPGTVLVHCSAGVGRTGTYIVLDAQLNQLKLTGTLSPLGFLCRARTQRNHLVQTEEQYVFVHDALLEHVRSGDTDVEYEKAREYLAKLLEDISEEELAVLDLNSNKNKSVNDLVSVMENGDTNSVSQKECSDKVETGSQVSTRTIDLDVEMRKSMKELNGEVEKEGMVNGEAEGMYDLAPRSTDTYSRKMQAFNNMTPEEKEEMQRLNRAENYAVLERMRSLAGRSNTFFGPPPVNLLEKQFQLITRCCVEGSACALSAHNADKNRPDGALPTDAARVLLVPKPGVEGSEYVNASWVAGRRRLREYAAAEHPRAPASDLWRLLWDHTAQLVLTLTDDDEPDCEVFWPTEEEKELFVANFRASFVSKETYVAYRKAERESPVSTPVASSPAPTAEPEVNGYRRQESDCADDERLIPENGSPISEAEPTYRFDRSSLRLERLSAGNRDLSARKSIANGDLFSSETRKGPKSPRSPSKMSLKNFRLSSPTKFKFPDWGSKVGSPPDTAPPPAPVPPSLTVEEETSLRRPCYTFERVDNIPEDVPSDRLIEVTNVSVHSLQDDYQLSVKFIKCSGWLNGGTTSYVIGKPDDNEYVRAVRADSDKEAAIDRLIEPYKDSFALVEFVAGCQMEYKNGPVVVVDKYGGWKALSFCTLSSSCETEAGAEAGAGALYRGWALSAHARAPRPHTRAADRPVTPRALLACYCALAHYGPLLALRTQDQRSSITSHQEIR